MTKPIISFAIASDTNYLKHVAALTVSIMENGSKDNIYRLYYLPAENVSSDDIKKLKKISRKYKNLEIEVLDASPYRKKLPHCGRYSSSAFDRLYLSLMNLPFEKILYLDCDMIALDDIKKLYDTDISEYHAAIVKDFGLEYLVRTKSTKYLDNEPRYKDYDWERYTNEILSLKNSYNMFNTGMMLINLAKWKTDNIHNLVTEFFIKYKTVFPDQDPLNKYLEGKVLYISNKWNLSAGSLTLPHLKDNLIPFQNDPGVVHYKPWLNPALPFADKYFEYFKMTPFAEKSFLSDKIFSVQKTETHRVIRMLGLKVKIRRKFSAYLSKNNPEKQFLPAFITDGGGGCKKIQPEEITVVLQGSTKGGADLSIGYVELAIESIRKILPGAKIILSTWKGENTSDLNADVTIFNDDPGFWVRDGGSASRPGVRLNNINRQIVSSINGLKKVSTKYALKMRTDFILTHDTFLHAFNKLNEFEDVYRAVKKRIIVNMFGTRKPYGKYFSLPFHVSDFTAFGLTEDLLNLYDIPLVSNEDRIWFKLHHEIEQKTYAIDRYNAEQSIFIGFLQKIGKDVPCRYSTHIDDSIADSSNHYLVNNFYPMSFATFGIQPLKDNLKAVNNYFKYTDYYTQYEWLKMYKAFCDKDFKLPKCDYERNLINKTISECEKLDRKKNKIIQKMGGSF